MPLIGIISSDSILKLKRATFFLNKSELFAVFPICMQILRSLNIDKLRNRSSIRKSQSNFLIWKRREILRKISAVMYNSHTIHRIRKTKINTVLFSFSFRWDIQVTSNILEKTDPKSTEKQEDDLPSVSKVCLPTSLFLYMRVSYFVW